MLSLRFPFWLFKINLNIHEKVVTVQFKLTYIHIRMYMFENELFFRKNLCKICSKMTFNLSHESDWEWQLFSIENWLLIEPYHSGIRYIILSTQIYPKVSKFWRMRLLRFGSFSNCYWRKFNLKLFHIISLILINKPHVLKSRIYSIQCKKLWITSLKPLIC
jgi:hypothetical protein